MNTFGETMKRLLAAGSLAAALTLSTPTLAHADNIDHGPFYKSDLSVACFVDKGEYPDDHSTARWACWRVVKLQYVNTSTLRTVYRGKLGKLYGVAWGEREDLTLDGLGSKAQGHRLHYEPTFFCYGKSNRDRRTWECYRDTRSVGGVLPLRWEKDELPDHCNDLTTYFVEGRRDNPSGPVRSTCR